MFKLIPAEEKHLDQIAPLLMETGYYDIAAVNNKLNLPAAEFYKIQTLLPYLKYTSVLISTEAAAGEEFAGYCITLTKAHIEEVEKNAPYWFADDPALERIWEQIDQFYLDNSNEHIIAYSAAIHPNYRGKGLYRVIHQYRQTMAKQYDCSKIVLIVWQQKSSKAYQIHQHYGYKYVGEIDCGDFFEDKLTDKLIKGVLELA